MVMCVSQPIKLDTHQAPTAPRLEWQWKRARHCFAHWHAVPPHRDGRCKKTLDARKGLRGVAPTFFFSIFLSLLKEKERGWGARSPIKMGFGKETPRPQKNSFPRAGSPVYRYHTIRRKIIMELGKREMELLQKINFIRTCGTEEEKKAKEKLKKCV